MEDTRARQDLETREFPANAYCNLRVKSAVASESPSAKDRAFTIAKRKREVSNCLMFELSNLARLYARAPLETRGYTSSTSGGIGSPMHRTTSNDIFLFSSIDMDSHSVISLSPGQWRMMNSPTLSISKTTLRVTSRVERPSGQLMLV